MNAVQLLGNLGRDPIIRATKTGREVASFSIAVSRIYTTPQGEQRELTDWINIVAWGTLAEAVRSELKKGSRVFVAGRISSRSYDAQDGTKRYVTEVVAETICRQLQAPSNNGQSYGNSQYSGGQQGGNNGNFGQFGEARPEKPPMKQENLPLGQGNAPFPAGNKDEDIPF
ncbi:single-stranded DNA-binding protein [uncultured Dialister sp.]|uniref:single-stranded DNA-binding protein n=1 Tax=uncultured Dialister sp. TaxID=278064 RepID=UPI002594F23F|nr:single-stranded DNA-binding protein [uncultured Dialister sp.]